jgi:exonuclease SbcD
MRFLHTGDWHVGRGLRGRSRGDEFAAALDEVVGVATSEGVDAVLVAGDLYDQRAVTADADTIVFETLIKLFEAGIPVLAVPGNHDSVARLAALAPLLDRIGVTVVPRMKPPKSGGFVEVPGRNGTESALVACLPFVSPRRFSDATQLFGDLSAGYVSFDEGMGDLLGAFADGFASNRVNVVLGHMFVSGAKPGGGERQVTIGADYAVSPAKLPGTAHYIALGHIHRPQAVRAAPAPTRYCGSLLQLDFGERDQAKSVVIVDAEPGRRARTKEVEISAGRTLLDVAGSIDELPALAGRVGDAYLRVTVRTEGPVPGIADRVREVLPNALDVRLEYESAEGERPEISLRSLEPRDQFAAYYLDRQGAQPPEDLIAAFDRIHDEVAS